MGLSPSPCRGVTLLELLIVMTILLMITAATIPIVVPAMQNRKMRESARLVSSYISGARSRAIETGRPVGVVFQRFNGLPFSMNLSYVEVPPPYSGDSAGATISVSPTGMVNAIAGAQIGLIRYGDTIKLNFHGPTFVIASATATDPEAGKAVPDPATKAWRLVTATGTIANFPAAYATGTPFQIFRQPVRSSVAPLQLPEGIVVDLLNSGIGLNGSFQPATPVVPSMWMTMPPVTFDPIVVFAPGGSIAYVTKRSASAGSRLIRPTESMYFLLGRRELMGDVFNKDPTMDTHDENLSPGVVGANAYLSNYWISIGYQTGQVVTSENATNVGAVNAARSIAVQAQSIGGR